MRSFLNSFTKIHMNMISAILTTPLSFFHKNPSGRILNRFSNDQGSVDNMLIFSMVDFLFISCFSLGVVVILSITIPYLLFVFLILLYVLKHVRKWFLSSSREIKRFEGITRSPVYEKFTENLKVNN